MLVETDRMIPVTKLQKELTKTCQGYLRGPQSFVYS